MTETGNGLRAGGTPTMIAGAAVVVAAVAVVLNGSAFAVALGVSGSPLDVYNHIGS